jgi:uridine phosphorylase
MTTMKREAHLTGRDLMGMVQLTPEAVGKYALVPGPRERADAIVKKLTDPIKNFSFMEYTMHTGEFAGTKVTTINGGRFAADTSITTEIMCNAGVKAMIRLGSCGALREDIKVGDMIVATTALKGDGVTQYYVDKDYVPTADKELTKKIKEIAQQMLPSQGLLENKVHEGCCWTTDAILRETKEHVNKAIAGGAIAVDMVSSAFLTICALYKIPAAVILAVSDNVITGEMGFMNTDYYMAEGALINIGLELVKQLEGSGQLAKK